MKQFLLLSLVEVRANTYSKYGNAKHNDFCTKSIEKKAMMSTFCFENCPSRKYTAYPHLAGTEGDTKLTQEVYDTWKAQRLDYVASVSYDVLLSYPDRTDPNLVTLLGTNGEILHQTQTVDKILSDDQNHTDVIAPFNAYSPAGNVTTVSISSHQS